jgi:hypothetical protein
MTFGEEKAVDSDVDNGSSEDIDEDDDEGWSDFGDEKGNLPAKALFDNNEFDTFEEALNYDREKGLDLVEVIREFSKLQL